AIILFLRLLLYASVTYNRQSQLFILHYDLIYQISATLGFQNATIFLFSSPIFQYAIAIYYFTFLRPNLLLWRTINQISVLNIKLIKNNEESFENFKRLEFIKFLIKQNKTISFNGVLPAFPFLSRANRQILI